MFFRVETSFVGHSKAHDTVWKRDGGSLLSQLQTRLAEQEAVVPLTSERFSELMTQQLVVSFLFAIVSSNLSPHAQTAVSDTNSQPASGYIGVTTSSKPSYST